MTDTIRSTKAAILLIVLMMPVAVHADFLVDHRGFSAGIMDSRYVYGIYSPLKSLDIRLEHSLYSEKIGFQRIGVGIGYGTSLPYGFKWRVSAMGATTWNRNYQVVWGEAGLRYDFRRLGIEAVINPRYDSGLQYMMCWEAGASVRIINPISVMIHYTTIPEFRMSEKRLVGGFEFRVANLRVMPKLSVGVERNTGLKNLRALMSMRYDF